MCCMVPNFETHSIFCEDVGKYHKGSMVGFLSGVLLRMVPKFI